MSTRRCALCNESVACGCVGYCRTHKALYCTTKCLCLLKQEAEAKAELEAKKQQENNYTQPVTAREKQIEAEWRTKGSDLAVYMALDTRLKAHDKINEVEQEKKQLERRNTINQKEIELLKAQLAEMKKMIMSADRDIHQRIDNLDYENKEDVKAIVNTANNGLRAARIAATVSVKSSPSPRKKITRPKKKAISHPIPDYSKVKSRIKKN